MSRPINMVGTAWLLLLGLVYSCGSDSSSKSSAECETKELDVASILAGLDGLPIDAFFEQSFDELMLTAPEGITAAGLSESMGIRDNQLNNISDVYKGRIYDLKVGILSILESYDRDSLGEEQQISYDIYHWMLTDWIEEWEFRYHSYPVSHWIKSLQNDLIRFFTDIHPLSSRQNAEDYVSRLGQVDNKLACLCENIALSRDAGIVPLRFMLETAAAQTRAITLAAPESLTLYTVFEDKLEEIDELSANDRADLLKLALLEIESSVIPGYQMLLETIEALIESAPEDGGAWQLPNGDAYYAYTLRHHTTTSMTADEIHELGLSEVERIQTEIRQVASDLGYPEELDLGSLFGQVAADSGIIPQSDVVSTYEDIIHHALSNLDDAFDIFPEIDVIVIGGATGGFYIAGADDGSRPGAFYAYNLSSLPWYDMPSLTYHEAVPGHHFQIAISQGLQLPLFRRKATGFTGYVEGWALYAERLVQELGFYDEDPYGNLGRLQYEIFRAVRLVVDTGLHSKHWTFDEAVQYFADNTGYSYGMAKGQISRYLVLPGQATAYKIGMLKILELRQRAQTELGDNFDPKDFHRAILTTGRVPLDILEQVIESYIK